MKLLPIKVTAEDIKELTGQAVNNDYNKHGLVVCEEVEKHFVEVRKEVNADVKAYKVNIDDSKSQLPNGYDAEKYRNIKLNELFEEITEADKVNNRIEKANDRIANAQDIVQNFNDEYKQRLADLQAEFDRRKKELADTRDMKVKAEIDKVKAAEKYLEENKIIDTEKMRQEVQEIEEGQSYLRVYDKLVESQKEYKKWSLEAERLTNIITEIRNLPTELLAEAKSPIEGMGVEKGNVTINGLPIKNLSDGVKMRLAIKIAKATSKELKLILLNGFEQLNWELQKEMFKEMQDDEYQYIVTRVTDGPLSISHIQDNEIINTETGETIELD